MRCSMMLLMRMSLHEHSRQAAGQRAATRDASFLFFILWQVKTCLPVHIAEVFVCFVQRGKALHMCPPSCIRLAPTAILNKMRE